jgi:hypothetical protein
MIPFLAIHAKGGENMSPKQKDRTTILIFKINDFQLVNFKLVSLCDQKGEQVVFSKLDILKPSWTLRGELIKGGFVLVKEKHFKTKGENFKLENASQKSYSFTFDYLAKWLWKRIYKRICKNKTCGASVVQNVKNKETIHAYLVSDIYWLNSKQSLHLHYAS